MPTFPVIVGVSKTNLLVAPIIKERIMLEVLRTRCSCVGWEFAPPFFNTTLKHTSPQFVLFYSFALYSCRVLHPFSPNTVNQFIGISHNTHSILKCWLLNLCKIILFVIHCMCLNIIKVFPCYTCLTCPTYLRCRHKCCITFYFILSFFITGE